MGCTINHSIKANFPELKVTIKADFSQREQQITLLQVTRGLFQAPPVRGSLSRLSLDQDSPQRPEQSFPPGGDGVEYAIVELM